MSKATLLVSTAIEWFSVVYKKTAIEKGYWDAKADLVQCCQEWNIVTMGDLANARLISATRIRSTFTPELADAVIALAGALLRYCGLPDHHMEVKNQALLEC